MQVKLAPQRSRPQQSAFELQSLPNTAQAAQVVPPDPRQSVPAQQSESNEQAPPLWEQAPQTPPWQTTGPLWGEQQSPAVEQLAPKAGSIRGSARRA